MEAQVSPVTGEAFPKPIPRGALDSYFSISERGSTTATEVLAGVSTFLALSYIFVVNPAILSQAGIPTSMSLFATITISALATILMGVWAKLPFAVSTGLEINGYVAFVVIGAMGFTWQQALGMVFWSGVLMVIVTLASIREKVIDSIPDALKIGLSFSVGMFLVLIAMKLSGLFVYEGLMLSGFGSLVSPAAICLYVGLAAILLLERFRVLGSVLISIIGVTVLYHVRASRGIAGFTPAAASSTPAISKEMFSGVGALSPAVLLDPRALSVILITHDMGVIAEMADDVVVMYLGRAVERGPVDAIFYDPKHPYTKSLLRSIPSITAKPRTKLATLEGSIPHPFARPKGCPFHPRCAEAIKGVCDRYEPVPIAQGEGRDVSCFLYGGQP